MLSYSQQDKSKGDSMKQLYAPVPSLFEITSWTKKEGGFYMLLIKIYTKLNKAWA